MTPQQQHFRRAAIAGFIFGLSAAIAFLLATLVGITASYLQAMLEGRAALLFSNISGWNMSMNALPVFFVAPLSYVMSAIFWTFALEAVARPEHSWIYHLTHSLIISLFMMSLLLGIAGQYVFVRNTDTSRLSDTVYLLLSTLFIHNITVYFAALGIAIEGYLARALPTWVCVAIGYTELSLIAFEFVALNPNIHPAKIILGTFIGSVRMILLAAYFWIASLPKQSINPESTETVIAP